MRLDVYLGENGYASSRQKAKDMICAGNVFVNGVSVTKPAYDVEESAEIEIRGEVLPYVGRGGYKLAGALDAFRIDPAGFTCVDIGASTGGFTDCLLQRGAAFVYAVDSGSGQLAPSLCADARVRSVEKFNARQLDASVTNGRVSLAVCDVSFISLSYIFEPVTRVLCPYDRETKAGSFLALIKPQFEAGRDAVGKNGIVRDAKVHLRVVQNVIACAETFGLSCAGAAPSPISGGDGNREFLGWFVYGCPEARDAALSDRAALARSLGL